MKLKIFLVEDNADTRLLLSYLLEEAGYEVHAADTLRAALRDFPRWHSDVLISDIGLPDGSGCELMRELRRNGASPYGIAMSGFGAVDDVAASLAAGFHHHMVKPIDIDVLERLLRSIRDG
jgi:DNA-binding response OmpR family regulator